MGRRDPYSPRHVAEPQDDASLSDARVAEPAQSDHRVIARLAREVQRLRSELAFLPRVVADATDEAAPVGFAVRGPSPPERGDVVSSHRPELWRQ
jgi:hypothetical protein